MDEKEKAIYSRNFELEEKERMEKGTVRKERRKCKDRRISSRDRRRRTLCRRFDNRRIVDHGPGYPGRSREAQEKYPTAGEQVEMSGKAQGEYKVYVSDSGAVHRDRRVKKWKISDIFGRRSTDKPVKPLGDHPGYVPGAKMVMAEAAKLRIPLFYTVKDACQEALVEERAKQERHFLEVVRSLERVKAKLEEIELTPLQVEMIAEGEVVQQVIDSQTAVTDAMRGVIKADPPGSGQVVPDTIPKRCDNCVYYVRRDSPDPYKAPEQVGGYCHRCAPGLNLKGYPIVAQDNWCGDHKLDEAKVK